MASYDLDDIRVYFQSSHTCFACARLDGMRCKLVALLFVCFFSLSAAKEYDNANGYRYTVVNPLSSPALLTLRIG